jgi:pycsar effector protein
MTSKSGRRGPILVSMTGRQQRRDVRRYPGGVDRRRPVDRAYRLLAANREELKKADQRAAQVLGVAVAVGTAAFGLLSGGLLSSGAGAAVGDGRPWLWWLSLSWWAASFAASMLALLPRLGGKIDARHLTFFGHVHGLDGRQISTALHGALREELAGLIAELRWTSRLAMLKYRLVRVSMVCLAVSALVALGNLW